MRDKGLAEADVSVKTSRCMVAENAVACFNSRLGAIYFKDVPRYSLPADTAAHEVELCLSACSNWQIEWRLFYV